MFKVQVSQGALTRTSASTGNPATLPFLGGKSPASPPRRSPKSGPSQEPKPWKEDVVLVLASPLALALLLPSSSAAPLLLQSFLSQLQLSQKTSAIPRHMIVLFELAKGMCQPPGQALKEDLPPTTPPSSAPTETQHPHGTPVANRPGGRRAEAHRRNCKGFIKHFSSLQQVLEQLRPVLEVKKPRLIPERN